MPYVARRWGLAYAAPAAIAFLVLYTDWGRAAIQWMSNGVANLLGYANKGTEFLFGPSAGNPLANTFAIAALPVIERVDRMLGEAFEAAGGIDRFLDQTAVLITSDHGHCEVLADAGRADLRSSRSSWASVLRSIWFSSP